MLNILREKKNVKLIMFFIAIIIIPAFVLWGVGSILRSNSKDSLAGIVFSTKISKQDFIDQYHAVYSQAQVLYGENLAKIKNLLNLEGQTWQRITLLEEAKRRKIKISDREVIDAIQSSPLFYKNNRFDQDTYQTILTYYLGLTPRKYEEQIRDSLKIKNLIEQETKDIQISEQEAWLTFQNQNTSYNIGYILIKPSDFTEDIEFGPEELENFYRDKKELFKKPEQVNIEYLAVIFKDLAGNIILTEDEIADYFYAHKEDFLSQPSGDEEEITEETKEKISQVLSASKARKEAENLVWQIEDDIISGLSIKEAAEKNSFILKETGFFSPWDPIPGIGWSYAITQDAFSLEPGETSNAIETKDGFYLIQVKDKKAPYLPELEEIKQQVETALRCLLYTSPSPRDRTRSRMPSSA